MQPGDSRLPVDPRQHPPAHRRIGDKGAADRRAGDLGAGKIQRGIERGFPVLAAGDVDRQGWPGDPEAKGVGVVHVHQRGNVHCFLTSRGYNRTVALDAVKYIAVAVAPGCVGYFRKHGLELLLARDEAVVEGDRILGQAEVTKVGEHANRTRRTTSGLPGNLITNGFVKRTIDRGEVVGPSEPDGGPGAGRPERMD